jgi:hypothetical protein
MEVEPAAAKRQSIHIEQLQVGSIRSVAVLPRSDQVRDRQCRQHRHASDPPLTRAG